MHRFTIAVLLFSVAYTGANICTDDTGYWLFTISEGVTDFAYGGSKLNSKYYCFQGCLNTKTAVQNYKVQLAGTNTSAVERTRTIKDIRSLHAQVGDEDPNAATCVDPVLRQDVANALKKTTQNNCKNIVNTLVLNLNRPGWAITCIKFDEISMDDATTDKNFCSYDASVNDGIYTIRLAKLDMS
uniref:Uncharacterized protein n=1 Tax=Caenorhabditis japonica TaxID=281687 RepID=A0A8R1I1J2_CAEJA